MRHHSLTYLQRALLLPELAATTLDCATDCFDNVIFPLLDELLKPEVCRLDSIGMEETRMRATGLLSKTFLHYFPSLFKKRDFLRLWGRILNYINRYMKVAESEYLVNPSPLSNARSYGTTQSFD